jgi:hypothetical protein
MRMGNRLAGRRPRVHAEVHPVDAEFLRKALVEVVANAMSSFISSVVHLAYADAAAT